MHEPNRDDERQLLDEMSEEYQRKRGGESVMDALPQVDVHIAVADQHRANATLLVRYTRLIDHIKTLAIRTETLWPFLSEVLGELANIHEREPGDTDSRDWKFAVDLQELTIEMRGLRAEGLGDGCGLTEKQRIEILCRK